MVTEPNTALMGPEDLEGLRSIVQNSGDWKKDFIPYHIRESLNILRKRARELRGDAGEDDTAVDRSKLMDRLKIKEPSGDYVEDILKEYLGAKEGPPTGPEHADAEVDRGELLKRLKIKEPSEKFLDGILADFGSAKDTGERKAPGPVEVERKRQKLESGLKRYPRKDFMGPLNQFKDYLESFDTSDLSAEQIIKFNEIMGAYQVAENNIQELEDKPDTGPEALTGSQMLEKFKTCLQDLFGVKLAKRMYDKQLSEVNLLQDYREMDIEKFLNSFKHVLEGFLGIESTTETLEKLKEQLLD